MIDCDIKRPRQRPAYRYTAKEIFSRKNYVVKKKIIHSNKS